MKTKNVDCVSKKARNHCQDVDHCTTIRKARNDCQDVGHCQEDNWSYHLEIDHCQDGNRCQDRDPSQNGNEHADDQDHWSTLKYNYCINFYTNMVLAST